MGSGSTPGYKFSPQRHFYLVAQYFMLSFEHNHTPRCSQEISAAGFILGRTLKSLVVKASLGKQSSLLLSTRSEVESFRHQGFVLPEMESLRVQSFMAS